MISGKIGKEWIYPMFDGKVSYDCPGDECPRDPTGTIANPFQTEVHR